MKHRGKNEPRRHEEHKGNAANKPLRVLSAFVVQQSSFQRPRGQIDWPRMWSEVLAYSLAVVSFGYEIVDYSGRAIGCGSRNLMFSPGPHGD